MSQLTDDEIFKLRELLDVAEIVKKDAEYKAALHLVMKTWKNIVIGVATVVGAVILLREHFVKFWAWFIGG